MSQMKKGKVIIGIEGIFDKAESVAYQVAKGKVSIRACYFSLRGRLK